MSVCMKQSNTLKTLNMVQFIPFINMNITLEMQHLHDLNKLIPSDRYKILQLNMYISVAGGSQDVTYSSIEQEEGWVTKYNKKIELIFFFPAWIHVIVFTGLQHTPEEPVYSNVRTWAAGTVSHRNTAGNYECLCSWFSTTRCHQGWKRTNLIGDQIWF